MNYTKVIGLIFYIYFCLFLNLIDQVLGIEDIECCIIFSESVETLNGFKSVLLFGGFS